MNWPLRTYDDKDTKSEIIDEKSDAGCVAAGGISPENICSASHNHVQHFFICVVNKESSPGFRAPCSELKVCDSW